VKRLDEIAELVDGTERVLPGTVAGVWSEKRYRGIPPVVAQAWRTILAVELEHRKKLNGGDAEILQVWDLLDHGRIGSAPLRGDPGARMPREAGDVHLVDDGRGEGSAQRRVTLPIVDIGIDHHTLHGDGILLTILARRVARISVGHDDGATVGIEEHLGGVETQTALGIEGAVGAIGINLSGTDAWHKDVPVMIGAMRARIELDHARRMRGGGIIEQQEVHPARLPREHAEIDAPGENGGTERETATPVYQPLRSSGFREFGLYFFKASAQRGRRVALPEELFIAHVLSWHRHPGYYLQLSLQFCREPLNPALTSIKPARRLLGFAHIS
jgi:hypothetical protein